MKLQLSFMAAAILALQSIHCPASVLYVDLNSTNPVSPYADWSTAATNIQDAIDVSSNGDLVSVADGNYRFGNSVNRVSLDNAITVQSVNGPAVTTITGQTTYPWMRCVFFGSSATLSGFTLTGGKAVWGGGAYFSSGGILSNCVITGNWAEYDGGGVYQGILYNCTVSGNSVGSSSVHGYGGGVIQSVCYNCTLSGNYSSFCGGGAYDSTLNNCLITGNSIAPYPNFGAGGGAVGGTLNNCTVVGNTVYYPSVGGGAQFSTANNCIVYYNNPDNLSSVTANYCCTTPLPSVGIGNIINAPLFVNQANGDFHLQSNSPCINSGDNLYVSVTNDFDGNPRIQGRTVDMGAYEYQTPSSVLSYAWAQQYGLPTDGSVDYLDLDGTGMNNWQKWIAGLNPTNSASILAMLTPIPTNNPSGLVVSWQSVNTRTYYLQSSTNLGAQPAFSTIQSNIVGQAGTTSYTDTTATNDGPYFYRVGVQ